LIRPYSPASFCSVPVRRVRDLKVESPTSCRAGWHPAAGWQPASFCRGPVGWPAHPGNGRPSTTQPQDAILPHSALRASSQQSALSVQLLNQACDCWLGALTAGCTKSSRRAKNMKDSNTKGPLPWRTRYAQIPAILRLNRPGLHFHVAHPCAPPRLTLFRGAPRYDSMMLRLTAIIAA